MEIISHRGYWLEKSERNLPIAFERSFDLGFGTETDVRDVSGQLVISHDMPNGDELPLEELLRIMAGRDLPLAVNIKADGLCEKLKATFERFAHSNWFVFDMAVPDMRSYLNASVPTYSRLSEVEPSPAWLEHCAGIWLDSFGEQWYDCSTISKFLALGKKVCIVSAELHGREHMAQWQQIADLKFEPNLMLCTDLPEAAKLYFKE